MEMYDIAVIGAGPAGVAAALHASDQGARVCIIEQDKIGSSCFRKGLYPLKAAIAALKENKENITTDDKVDIEVITKYVTIAMRSISRKWKTKLADFGVKIYSGRGIPLSPKVIEIETDDENIEIQAKKIILATGSYPTSFPTLPFEEDVIISADDIFQSDKIPETVFIMGGGSSGCEIANFYQRLGSKVFLSHHESRLLYRQDPDVMDVVEGLLKKDKIKLLLNKNLSSYYKNNGRFDLTLNGGVKFQSEKIVQNLDRNGNSSNLGCEELEIRLGEHKEILVNENLETSCPGIFAIGSVTGKKTSSGVSEEEGRVAADNAMGKNKSLNADWIPFIVHTTPEIACVGCFSEEAHYKGFRAIEGKINTENLDFSYLGNGSNGFFKIVADARSGVVMGGQIVSPNASQLISLMLIAIKKGMKVGALASLACDKSGEIQGIREAARLCSKALKTQLKTL